jgi:hypothetical protein
LTSGGVPHAPSFEIDIEPVQVTPAGTPHAHEVQ